MITCNVSICKYNNNCKCTKENVIIDISYDDGLTTTCRDFDTSITFIEKQYGFINYQNTLIIVSLDSINSISRDIYKLLIIVKQKLSKKPTLIYFDNIISVGPRAHNRIICFNTEENRWYTPDKHVLEEVMSITKMKYPNLK